MLALDGLEEIPAGNTTETSNARRITGDPLTFLLAPTGRGDPAYSANLERAVPRSVRARRRMLGLVRRIRMKVDPPFEKERWRLSYLMDVIYTRDTWMHRGDVSRATGRDIVLTPEHDGRIVADVVAEWGRRHGRPFTLTLTGPAGGAYVAGDGGEDIELDAVEFCRILSGRAQGVGLLATAVPF